MSDNTHMARCGGYCAIFSFDPEWHSLDIGLAVANAAGATLCAIKAADSVPEASSGFDVDQRESAMRGAQFLIEMAAAVMREEIRAQERASKRATKRRVRKGGAT